MPDPDEKHRLWFKWLLIFAFWTLAAFYFATQIVTQTTLSQRPVSFWRALSWQMVSAYLWCGLLMPFILWMGRRFPLERGAWRRSLPAHLAGGVVAALVSQAADALLLPKLGYLASRNFPSYWQAYKTFLIVNFHFSFALYWAVQGINQGLRYYQKLRERELRATQLEAKLAQTQLQVLRMQLHPHFLFNTLHAISELIYKDPEAAEQMIADLSDLLRVSLETVGAQEVPLQQEVDFLKKYLEIEQTRFHDRLELQLEIAPDTLDARVPNMIFQPLVENAIRHGIAPHAAGGRVAIGARRVNGTLHLHVTDNGRGLPQNLREGVGLTNTRARLRHLYGDAHRLDLHDAPGGGVALELEIPFRRAGHDDKNIGRG
jgi:signal transduction histidine kinase